jgi:hypothetical protein
MAVIIRILAVIFAYVLACLGAGIVLTLRILTPPWDELSPENVAVVSAFIAIAAIMVAAAALVPALLVVVLAEAFAWRSSLVYAALGGALALLLANGGDFAALFDGTFGPQAREKLQHDLAQNASHAREVPAAAGIAGGLVYWLVAGRRAGAWKREMRA